MKRYIFRRILTGFLAFVLTIALITTIYEVYKEIELKETIDKTYKLIIGNMIAGGEFEGKTLAERKEIRAQVNLAVKARYGLDRSRTARVLERTYKMITFDWEYTRYGRKTSAKGEIFEALPNTLVLFVTTTIISMIISIYLGVKKAQHVNSLFDRVTSVITMFFIGFPSWLTGSFLILFFVYYLDILPFGALYSTDPPPVGMINMIIDRLMHMTIPIMAVVLGKIWGSAYQIRNILLDHLQKDYISSARGRGLPERKVLFKHALRTAFPAIITMALLTIIEAISGDIIVEKILGWPGIGLLLWNAIKSTNLNVILCITTMLTLIFVFALVLLDITYVLLDPRIKYS